MQHTMAAYLSVYAAYNGSVYAVYNGGLFECICSIQWWLI